MKKKGVRSVRNVSKGLSLTEHNQKGFWLCPITNVYHRETVDSLNRLCMHCKKVVRYCHEESPHQTDRCPSEEVKGGRPLQMHASFYVMSIDGPQRYKITTKPYRRPTAADFTDAKLDEICSRYPKRKSKEENEKNAQKPGSLTAARMLAPGLFVVYKKELKEEQDTLSWGIGVCVTVDEAKKTFRVKELAPTDSRVTVAPWKKWVETDNTKEFLHSDPGWMKVRNLIRGRIRTDVLRKIRNDARFSWQWIQLLDTTNLPQPSEFVIETLDRDNEE